MGGGLRPAGLGSMAPPRGWKPPSSIYVVAATPRSGSTYLSELLSKTGQLGSPREFFKPTSDKPEDDASVMRRCELVRTRGATANGVAGVKLFARHFWWLQSRIRLSEWFPGIRWVHIRRSDRLGQAISAAIASETDQWWGKRDAASPTPVFSARLIEEKLLELLAEELSWTAFFQRNEIEPLSILYEDLEQRPGEYVEAVAALMGVVLDREPAIETKATRQRDTLNEEWRARFVAEAGSQDWLDPAFLWRPVGRTPRNILRFLRGELAVGPPLADRPFEEERRSTPSRGGDRRGRRSAVGGQSD
jgi:LPS sulfotransferase NodH